MYYKSDGNGTITATKSKATELVLPAGKYIIVGNSLVKYNSLQSYLEITDGNNVLSASSGYDNYGYVGRNCSIIVELSQQTTIELNWNINTGSRSAYYSLRAISI